MSLDTFVLTHVIVSAGRAIMVPYLFIYGWVLIGTFHLQQAYGYRVAGYGVALLLVSMNEAVSTFLGVWGFRRHNKALVAVHLLLDMIFGIIQLGLGLGLLVMVRPQVPYDVQRDCVMSVMGVDDATCRAFLKSDRTMGFRLAWRSYYTQSLKSSRNFQILYEIEDTYRCCGYGPPDRCEVDQRKLPSVYPTYSTLNDYKNHRQLCGLKEGWYTAASTCNEVIDYDAAVWVYGGCHYDVPVGGCSAQAVKDKSRGCAPEFEQYMARKIESHGRTIIANNFFKFFAILMGFLLWFARRENEGVPKIYVTPDPPSYFIFRMFNINANKQIAADSEEKA